MGRQLAGLLSRRAGASAAALEAGVDSIEHGSFLTEATLKLMKQKGNTSLYKTTSSSGL